LNKICHFGDWKQQQVEADNQTRSHLLLGHIFMKSGILFQVMISLGHEQSGQSPPIDLLQHMRKF
jgi:hypothetical protein